MEFISFSRRGAFILVMMMVMSSLVSSYGNNAHRARNGSLKSTPKRDRDDHRRTYYNRHQRDFFGDNFLKHFLDVGQFETESKPIKRPLVLPYSGEQIRLQNTEELINSGLVQVYRGGQWGYICADGWDTKDANVACKHLGFDEGTYSQSMINENMEYIQRANVKYLLSGLNCRGTETSIQMCSYNNVNRCFMKKAASVACKHNHDCPDGWIGGFGKCYKFFSKAKSIQLAASVCVRENASLLTLESPAENHFISNILKNSLPDVRQWYTGGTKTNGVWEWNRLIANPDLRKRYAPEKTAFITKKTAVAFNRWFPGWPLHNSIYAEPSNDKLHKCLTLSDEFKSPHNGTALVDYFYWKAEMCRHNGGMHFICQMDDQIKNEISQQDCYTGNGLSYRGNTAVSEKGTTCLNWALSKEVNVITHPNKGLGDHNYCRNPDNDVRPWCWVNMRENKFAFCKIPKCSDLVSTEGDTTTITPTDLVSTEEDTTTPPPLTTTPTQECYTDRGLNYRGYVAISEKGAECLSWTFSTQVNERTHPNSGLGDHNYCRNPDNDVRPWCWVNTNANVFGYCKIQTCSDLVSLKQTTSTIANSTTTTTTTITSSPAPIEEIKVELVGGYNYSGTVLITYRGKKGVICDDKWSLEDAKVICKMLGYSNAKQETEMNYFNYQIKDVQFVLDEVMCFGYEETIDDCVKSPWNTHDCEPYEIAGVICQLNKECEAHHFKCRNNHCVGASAICNKKDDCQDNSDEQDCDSIKIKLLNGSVPWEGRVQLSRNGHSGSICDDKWDDNDATVVCRMLGYIQGGKALRGGSFGSEVGTIWLDNVQCDGTETSLELCFHSGWAVNDCTHKEDVGVRCYKNESISVPIITPIPIKNSTTNLETSNSNVKCGLRPYDYIDNMNPKERKSSNDDDSISKLQNLSLDQTQKIIGGNYAVHGAYPWQARVHHVLTITPDGSVYGLHHCGAVIISEYWLLSAAHCFINKRPSDFRIIVGDFDLRTKDTGEQVFSVDKIILHEEYVDETKNNDISLVKIQPNSNGHGIKFTNYAQPACLVDPAEAFKEGTKCLLSGWGNTVFNSEGGEYPRILKAVQVPLISHRLCSYLHTKRIEGFISDRMFCAGYLKGGIDSCDGDSGGPLICKTNGVYKVFGITSWGRGCAIPDLPGVYTRISFFVPWIKSKIKLFSENKEQSFIPSN